MALKFLIKTSSISLLGIKRCPFSITSRCPFSITSTRKLCVKDDNSQVVVVTGGGGFLGQHIVHLLQTKDDSVKEIRTIDLKPYDKFLEFTETKPHRHYIGDIREYDDMKEVLKGVDAVFHIAGLVSFGTNPDINEMKDINISGTANVIQACMEQNVPRLIFCSTVDVVIGFEDIIDGTEESTTVPKEFLFPGYTKTKYNAEKLVTEHNGILLAGGNRFHTVSLRPNVIYGEGDPYLITTGLQNAKNMNGWAIRVGNGTALLQQAYVGNVAWAFIKANQALQKNPTDVGGHSYFVPDDTPVKNVFDGLVPYLIDHGFNLSPIKIPYWLIYAVLYTRELFLKLLSPIIKINAQPPLSSIIYINMNLTFTNTKAKNMLDYKPLYSPDESLSRSRKFYKSLEFK